MGAFEDVRYLEANVTNSPDLWRPLANAYVRLGLEAPANLANARAIQFELGPIEILDIQIEWMERFANPPSVRLLLNRLPTNEEFIYSQNKEMSALHYAESHGMARYWSYIQPDRGFGGRHFNILMDTGEYKTLIGPWSSGSYAMNQYGFGPCMEICYTNSPKTMEQGYTFYGGSIRVDKIVPHLAERGLGLVLMKSDTYEVTSRAKYPDRQYYAKSCKPGNLSSFATVAEEILPAQD